MTAPQQTIHVVDDDEAMRDSMTWLLEAEGYRVACFDSAAAFLGAWRSTLRGCIVLDVRMPEMSGLELQEKLESIGSRLPIIFVTGHGDVPMAVGALQRGACDFIEKPFHNADPPPPRAARPSRRSAGPAGTRTSRRSSASYRPARRVRPGSGSRGNAPP